MKILHYSLGFPPYRSGGLTKFCMDLMREQIKEGHEVSLLWPGEMSLFTSVVKIKKGEGTDGITSYEVINPLPVSYDEGIMSFEAFVIEGKKSVFDEFLKELKPEPCTEKERSAVPSTPVKSAAYVIARHCRFLRSLSSSHPRTGPLRIQRSLRR